MAEKNYEFREEMCKVHKANRRDESKKPTDGQITFDESYAITVDCALEGMEKEVVLNAASDLSDYFSVSMGINIAVKCESEASGNIIFYKIDKTLPLDSYRVSVSDGQVILTGSSARMAAQAGYYIEDLMNLEEAPFLTKGEQERSHIFRTRMTHSGVGLDMFPDEHLISIAHAGMTSILIFVKGINTTPHGYQDFNEICLRAAKYGLDVYVYSYLRSYRYPNGKKAEEFYDGLYGNLFEQCPHFKGVIFVGESCEFPSKDRENTTGMLRLENKDFDGNPIIKNRMSPGWWPCYDYPIWLNMVKKVIRAKKPDAEIVFWTYNWGQRPEESRLRLIRNLPKDITHMATFEMGCPIVHDGIEHPSADYTIYFEGPSNYFTSEAKCAKECNLPMYSMTNTGGRTWDVGVVPYLPVPYQWMKRYESMRYAHDNYSLVGTMECHHYGFTPSFISELAKWAFSNPPVDLDAMLKKIVKRDFGEKCVDKVCEALKCFSEGINQMIATNPDQYGPCRIGPAYPFVLFKGTDLEIPSEPIAMFGKNRITKPVYSYGLYNEPRQNLFLHELECFKKTVEFYKKGCEIIDGILPLVPDKKKETAIKIRNIGEFIGRTAQTTINIKEWYQIRVFLPEKSGDEKNKMLDGLLEIARREMQNALDTIPLVEFDSRLGFEPSMEYMCDRAHIEWKLGLLQKVIDEEIPALYDK
ncbi:MAG: hypothetical protein E7587_04400 [Ruminococcaceae bacterium]|nr:hypothetical protein [Oscillospiraceae bacterium]